MAQFDSTVRVQTSFHKWRIRADAITAKNSVSYSNWARLPSSACALAPSKIAATCSSGASDEGEAFAAGSGSSDGGVWLLDAEDLAHARSRPRFDDL